jgi:membrane protease YdiL (CAAX protease family)
MAEQTRRRRSAWWQLVRDLLLMLAIIGGVAYAAFPIALPFGFLSDPESRLGVFLVGSICGEAAAFGVLVWLLHRRGPSLSALGWGRPATPLAWVLGLIVAIVYSAITSLNPSVGPNLLRFTPLKFLALAAAAVAGIVEETIFRGYVIRSLSQMGYANATQACVSGAIFALAHVYAFTSPLSILVTIGYTFAFGAALAAVYLIAKRSLTPVIGAHFLTDAVIEPWLLLSFFVGH